MKKLHFKSIDSTSLYLKRNSEAFFNLTFLRADYQTNGKGRGDHYWYSRKKENLLFSFLIKDKDILNLGSSMSLFVGYEIFNVLNDLGLKDLAIKWPNDIYVGGKKICGILLESISSGENISALVVGIGINVNQTSFASEFNATSIINELNKKQNIKKIYKRIIKTLVNDLEKIKINDLDYMKVINDNNYLLNKDINVIYQNKKETVKVLYINEDGSLKVDLKGKEINIYSNEVELLK